MTKPLIKFNLRSVEQKLMQHLKRNMTQVVVLLDSIVKGSMNTSNLRGTNPSAPGEVPHVGKAILKSSITHKVEVHKNEVVGSYGVSGESPAAAYARRLELGFIGTDKRGRIYNQAPRPYLTPAYMNNKRKIKQILRG